MTATVQPGGRIEVADAQLLAGEAVDLIVLFPQERASSRRSVADAYLEEERDAWDR